ncbi:MAG TPA: hypothetical protein VNE63_01905 [Candidatus Acidoferrales bacterium]|nr:hypothetical protein [Candidatus Acidoferrales bacterium]
MLCTYYELLDLVGVYFAPQYDTSASSTLPSPLELLRRLMILFKLKPSDWSAAYRIIGR